MKNSVLKWLKKGTVLLVSASVLACCILGLTGCGEKESAAEAVTVRVAALKGPTTMGLVNLMADAAAGETEGSYEFTMYAAGSDVMAEMVAGNVDIGLVPSNVAAVMDKKVEGGVSVIDINTLGVLYCVTGREDVTALEDLAGETVYMTGQGATPEYTVRYLLEQKGISDCDLQFKSEPTEIASLMAEDASVIAILPQPFVTAVQVQNESVKAVFSLDDAWEQVAPDSSIVTGVTVVTNSFLEAHPQAVDAFLEAHAASAQEALSHVDATAALVVEQGIVAKEPIAARAISDCNIVCITGEKMKSLLSAYLQVLYDQEPKSVGGSLPEDGFYYVK